MAADEIELDGREKKGGLPKVLIILVLLIVVGGGALAALRFLAPGTIPGLGEKPAATTGNSAGEMKDQPVIGIIFNLKPFIVNLRDPVGKRYLKIEMSLELASEALQKEVQTKLPPIRNDILLLLSSMSYEDIADDEGKMRLRRRIKDKCDVYLTQGKVSNVYFSEFVVQ